MSKIVIIGGGIAGLSAAYDLHRDGRHDVVLLEASSRLGGKIGTVHESGYLIEQGPDSVFTTKPWATELMTEIGLESEFVEPIGGGFSMYVGGKLHPVPRALASLMPSASTALEKVGFWSAAVRDRILSEKQVAKGDGGDESVASFFRRRFGKRFSSTLAEPLLAGIHAGDPHKLSMKALYPMYLGLEQKHGSLTADRPVPPPSGAKKPATFMTLERGMASFVDKLVKSAQGVVIRTQAPVAAILGRNSHLEVSLVSGDTVEADHVIVAAPAKVASHLLKGIAPATEAPLDSIRFASTAVATLSFRRSGFKRSFEDNGFLIPFEEAKDVTGVTLSSNKWPGRAADDVLLLRAFMGNDGGLDIDPFSDQELLARAVQSVAEIMGPSDGPIFTRLDRWTKAMPQYEVGHLDKIEEIEAAIAGLPVHLTGSSYRGSGIPDCVRQGREAARAVLEQLA